MKRLFQPAHEYAALLRIVRFVNANHFLREGNNLCMMEQGVYRIHMRPRRKGQAGHTAPVPLPDSINNGVHFGIPLLSTWPYSTTEPSMQRAVRQLVPQS